MLEPNNNESIGLGSIFGAHHEALPKEFFDHESMDSLLTAVDRFDPDLAMFFQYYEWNLKSNKIDFSLVLPTYLFGGIRLAIKTTTHGILDRIRDFTSLPSQALQTLTTKIEEQDAQDPLLPRAISLSFERIVATMSELNFVFIDFDESIKLNAKNPQLSTIFGAFGESIGKDSSSISILEDACDKSRLAHCGIGTRNGSTRYKVYLEGTLSGFLDSPAGKSCQHLFGDFLHELKDLAELIGDRLCHMVIDVSNSQIIRSGFELNIDSRHDSQYGNAVVNTDIWKQYATLSNPKPLYQLIKNKHHKITHANGNTSELFISHLKLSFDGSNTPEWKVYFSCSSDF